MLELALNYVTVSFATVALAILIVLFFIKRKQLSKGQKIMICCAGTMIAIYFVLILVLVFAFGSTHPSGEPTPVENSESQNLNEISFDKAMDTVKAMYPEPFIIEADGDRTTVKDEVGYAFRISMPIVQGDSTEQTPSLVHIVGVVKNTGEIWEYLADRDEWIKATAGKVDSAIPESVGSEATYHFTRYGKDGEAISIAALTDEKLAKSIIMDVLSKSAAWQGVDIATLEEYYLIEQTLTATDETHKYYAYLLDGKAVLQGGNNGMYSYLSQELYDELDGIYTDVVDRTDTVSP